MARLFVPTGFEAASVSPDLYLFLQKEPNDLFVLLEFYSPGRDRRQIDVAVLVPYGVDVVEVKAKVGGAVIASDNGPWHVRQDDGRTEALPLNGAAKENPYDQAGRTAEDLRRWLESGLNIRTQVYPLALVPQYRREASLRNRGFVWAANGLSGFKRSLRSLRLYKDVPMSLAFEDYRRIIEALELTELGGSREDPVPHVVSRASAFDTAKMSPTEPFPASQLATPVVSLPSPSVQPPVDAAPLPTSTPPKRTWPLALAGLVAALALVGVRQVTSPPSAANPTPTAAAVSTETGKAVVAGFAPPVGSGCPASHLVKGNVNDEGERIFHVEGQRYYEATNPEACFSTADAAVAEGFRASLR